MSEKMLVNQALDERDLLVKKMAVMWANIIKDKAAADAAALFVDRRYYYDKRKNRNRII